MNSENADVEDSLHKARVAYRIGAKVEDIADYTGLEEDFVSGYLDDQDLDEEDRVSYNINMEVDAASGKAVRDVQDQVSEMAIEVVEQVYDNWRNIEELPSTVRDVKTGSGYRNSNNLVKSNVREIANVFGQEEFGDDYSIRNDSVASRHGFARSMDRAKEGRHIASTPDDIPEDHPEDSLNTLLKSQRFVAPEDDQNKTELYTGSIEWFVDRRGGSASPSEMAEFLEFVMNYDPGFPTESEAERLATRSDKLKPFGTVTGGGERFSAGDRIYQTTSEPDVDDNWEEFLEGTMERIEEELEGGRHSRSKFGAAADAEKLVGAD